MTSKKTNKFSPEVRERTFRDKAKHDRSLYRERVLGALTNAGFTLAAEPRWRDENHFFSADLFYPGLFAPGLGLRPHIRVEMSLLAPRFPQSPGLLAP